MFFNVFLFFYLQSNVFNIYGFTADSAASAHCDFLLKCTVYKHTYLLTYLGLHIR